MKIYKSHFTLKSVHPDANEYTSNIINKILKYERIEYYGFKFYRSVFVDGSIKWSVIHNTSKESDLEKIYQLEIRKKKLKRILYPLGYKNT